MAVSESIFRPILVATTLEVAVMNELRRWMPTYQQEVEWQLGRTKGEIPPPRHYTTRNQFESWPVDWMPMCVVISSGIVQPPAPDGEGRYRAAWGIGVGMIASASDEEAASFLARFYAASVRAVLLQHQSLMDENGDQFAAGIDWIDEIYDDDLVQPEDRTVKSARQVFLVWTDDVVTKYGGPTQPTVPDPALPGSEWPTADIVDIKVVI